VVEEDPLEPLVEEEPDEAVLDDEVVESVVDVVLSLSLEDAVVVSLDDEGGGARAADNSLSLMLPSLSLSIAANRSSIEDVESVEVASVLVPSLELSNVARAALSSLSLMLPSPLLSMLENRSSIDESEVSDDDVAPERALSSSLSLTLPLPSVSRLLNRLEVLLSFPWASINADPVSELN